ncbi:MAG: TetR/AcrR family transcriptional regulator [Methylococcus sp.]|nr:TetR/AcrR family transcriptional regulator [Methylococcus sp.]
MEKPSSARERILETAQRLFYRNGIRATGVDRIIAESGVAKMSFYRNFPSKKDLVLAFLERRHEFWMGWFRASMAAQIEREGRFRLAFVAEFLREWFESPDFRGCAFINTAAETAELSDDERQRVVGHKDELCSYIAGLLRPGAAGESLAKARLAVLIIDGAIVRAQMCGDPAIAGEAGVLLEMLERA